MCKCFGFFKYETTEFDYTKMPSFAEGSIKILYRDQIRVFYNKVQNAQLDGYSEFKSNLFTNKTKEAISKLRSRLYETLSSKEE